MKILDIINEVVPTSQEYSKLNNIIKQCFYYSFKEEVTKARNKPYLLSNEIHNMCNDIVNSFIKNLEFNIGSKYDITFELGRPTTSSGREVGGTADYKNKVIINKNKINIQQILNNFEGKLFDYFIDNGWYEEDAKDMSIVRYEIKTLNDNNVNQFLNNIYIGNFSDFIKTFVHELAHVKQDKSHKADIYKKWPIRYEPSYRSYLTKNKKLFYKAISDLESEKDFLLYHASPQEIAAFANGESVKIIDNILDGKPLDDDRYVTELFDSYRITSSILSSLPNEPSFFYNVTQYYSDTFNKPENKKYYPIFKRFFKLLYMELVKFKDQIKKQIDKKVNDKAYSTVWTIIDTYDWSNDEDWSAIAKEESSNTINAVLDLIDVQSLGEINTKIELQSCLLYLYNFKKEILEILLQKTTDENYNTSISRFFKLLLPNLKNFENSIRERIQNEKSNNNQTSEDPNN